MFARRGYNVQSLAVGNSEREGMSRITMVVPASHAGIANLIKQLNKLVYVEKVGSLWRALPVPLSSQPCRTYGACVALAPLPTLALSCSGAGWLLSDAGSC